MARELRKQEVADAVKAWADQEGMTISSNERGFTLMPGDISIYVENGKLICTSSDSALADTTKMAVSEKIMEMAEEDPKPRQTEDRPGQANVPAVPTKGHEQGKSFDMEAWRGSQARTYSVAGKNAPNAFAVSEEANKRGLSTQIIDAGRTKDLVWGHVRVTDPKTGQFREDRVSHERETFCLLKSWEDANSQAKYNKGLIMGVRENSMPDLNPDIKIKGMPSQLWLTITIMRSWSMADRDAVTKAERRAQLKMLSREWREDDEIVLEQEEEKAVNDMKEERR